ncbi:MAG: sugar transferase [Caldiserica bacterium]|nr:sugar transferase [Caldisericota bacterium]
MKRRDIRSIDAIQFVADMGFVAASYYVVYWLRAAFGVPYRIGSLAPLTSVLPWLLLVFAVLYFVYGLGAGSGLGYYESFLSLTVSLTVLAMMTFAVSFVVREFGVPRTVVVLAWLVQLASLSSVNAVMLRWQHHFSSSLAVVCVSRTQHSADILSGELRESRGMAPTTIVCSDRLADLPVIPVGLDAMVLDASLAPEVRASLLREAALRSVRTFIAPAPEDLLVQNASQVYAGGRLLLELKPLTYGPADAVAKRVLDVVVSLVALVVLSPVALTAVCLILVDSGRPVFYVQERIGAGGRPFRAIKLRTMMVGAERSTGAVLSSDGDRRITRAGRLLRKTGLDEFPQFFNVLRGDMSVVGPRPERPELASGIREQVSGFDLRVVVKPGITGMAQIRGSYETPAETKLLMDLGYLRQRPVILTDIYVILNTVRMFFQPSRRK